MLMAGLPTGFPWCNGVIMLSMKYQSRKTKLVTAMITVSLTGLMAVQLLLLALAWELKDQAFQRNVITALAISAQDLEAGEITDNALEVIYRNGLADTLRPQMRSYQYQNPGRDILRTHVSHLDSTIFTVDPLPEYIVPEASGLFSPDTTSGQTQITFVMADGRFQLIQQIVGDLVVQTPRPILERLNRTDIDSLLRVNLDAVEISLEPDFFVFAEGSDSLIISNVSDNHDLDMGKLRNSKFRSRLFPLDHFSQPFEIALHFPGQSRYLLQQVWPLLTASVVFIGVIIGAFIWMLAAATQQRRFAGRIVDFINNMTHEFKTPISTVALASEAIARDDILEQPEALQRYNRMIRDENHRMRQQVERILQIAQLETGDFQLNLAQVNANDLARSCADNFALQIEKRGGTLRLDLNADQPIVLGDPVHLANVLANLLDNAIKYSPETPTIRLETKNQRDLLVIRVSDQGTGIDKSDRERVFEKYYRCPTGDRHDVKGFGLGLSYVKLLVEAHGGAVKLDGKTSHGTCVVFSIPLDSSHPQPGSIN